MNQPYRLQPVALITGDWHTHKWAQYNENNRRLNSGLDLFKFFGNKAKDLNVPILFTGDMFENPKSINNSVITKSVRYYRKYIEKQGVQFIAISGNHDQEERNTMFHKSPTYLEVFNETFKTFHLIDGKFRAIKDALVFGVPYFKSNIGLKETIKDFSKIKDPKLPLRILLIHTDLHGAKSTDGRLVDTVENIDEDQSNLFKSFNLVFSGHIHKPQVIAKNHIYMIGAPQQQNRGDKNCEMGYWILYKDRVNDKTHMVFYPLDYPKFIEIPKDQFDKLTDDEKQKNYYIPITQADSEVDEENAKGFAEFSSSKDRKRIAKNWAKATGLKDKAKLKTLIKLLQ